MTKGDRWRELFQSKGWIKDDVVTGGEDFKISMVIAGCCDSPDRCYKRIDSAMLLPGLDILCYEEPKGTVFFQWDDLVQVRLEPSSGKKGWL